MNQNLGSKDRVLFNLIPKLEVVFRKRRLYAFEFDDVFNDFYVKKWVRANIDDANNATNYIVTSFVRHMESMIVANKYNKCVTAGPDIIEANGPVDRGFEARIIDEDVRRRVLERIKSEKKKDLRETALAIVEEESVVKAAKKLGIKVARAKFLMFSQIKKYKKGIN